jgi:hypothetical protein
MAAEQSGNEDWLAFTFNSPYSARSLLKKAKINRKMTKPEAHYSQTRESDVRLACPSIITI